MSGTDPSQALELDFASGWSGCEMWRLSLCKPCESSFSDAQVERIAVTTAVTYKLRPKQRSSRA